jgi:hypothetical protein
MILYCCEWCKQKARFAINRVSTTGGVEIFPDTHGASRHVCSNVECLQRELTHVNFKLQFFPTKTELTNG